MRTLNKDNMESFVAYVARCYGVRILDKRSRPSRGVRWAAATMGIKSVSTWLDKWSITIPGVVWLGFEIGEGEPHTLCRQIGVICHELVHVEQWRKDKFRFLFRYVFSKSRRAHYEAEALHANIDMGYLLSEPRSPWQLANMLYAYRCRTDDVIVTRKHLEVYSRTAQQGAISTHPCKLAKAWWRI